MKSKKIQWPFLFIKMLCPRRLSATKLEDRPDKRVVANPILEINQKKTILD